MARRKDFNAFSRIARMKGKRLENLKNQQNVVNKKQTTNKNAGASTSARVTNRGPNPDVANIPVNENGTFIAKIIMPCTFCRSKFDRPDEYYLHHAEKHAKLYGILPNQAKNDLKEVANIDTQTGNSSPLQATASDGSSRKRKRSVSYIHEQTSSSSSDSDSSDDEIPKKAGKSSDAANEREETSNKDVNNLRKGKERATSKSKSNNTSSFSDSDDDTDTDDSCSVKVLQSILNKFVKNTQKLGISLLKHLRNKRKIIRKKKKHYNKILFKCKTCSLHFLKEREWRKHVKTGKHYEDKETDKRSIHSLKCDHCCINISHKSWKKHMKMHEKDGQVLKHLHLKVITNNSDSSSEDSSGTSTSDSSESEEEHSTVTISKPGRSKEASREPSNSKIEEKTENKSKEQENDNNNIQVHPDKAQGIGRKYKAILFKCDDCEEHFLTRKNVEIHSKNSTHHRMLKNTNCEICTLKFSSIATLQQHKRLHHNGRQNLSKEDFKIILWTKFRQGLPDRPKLMKPRLYKRSIETNKQIPTQVEPKSVNCKLQKNELLLYRCDGCYLHFLNYQTFISHTQCCKLDKTKKIKCPKCQLYFSKTTLNKHNEIHKKKQNLKKSDFLIKSRKPRNFKTAVIPQSNIVSTTEDNVEKNTINKESVANTDTLETEQSIRDTTQNNEETNTRNKESVSTTETSETEQGINENTSNASVQENDTCRVKLSKISNNRWSIVSNNDERDVASDNNKQDDASTCEEQAHTIENLLLDSTNDVINKDIETENSRFHTDNINTVVHSTSQNSLTDIEAGNGAASSEVIQTPNENLRNDEDVMEIFHSAYFDKSQDKISSSEFVEQCTADTSGMKTAANDNSQIDTVENVHRQIKDENISEPVKSESLETEVNSPLKNKSVHEEIKTETDNVSSETKNVTYTSHPDIKIAKCCSLRITFEDSNSGINEIQNKYMNNNNLNQNDIKPLDRQTDVKVELDEPIDVKEHTTIPPENLQSSPEDDCEVRNVLETMNATTQQKVVRDIDNNSCNSHDSEATLLLEEYSVKQEDDLQIIKKEENEPFTYKNENEMHKKNDSRLIENNEVSTKPSCINTNPNCKDGNRYSKATYFGNFRIRDRAETNLKTQEEPKNECFTELLIRHVKKEPVDRDRKHVYSQPIKRSVAVDTVPEVIDLIDNDDVILIDD